MFLTQQFQLLRVANKTSLQTLAYPPPPHLLQSTSILDNIIQSNKFPSIRHIERLVPPVLQVELATHCYHTSPVVPVICFCTRKKRKAISALVFTPARIPTPLPLPAQRHRYLQSMLSASPKGPLVSWVCLQWAASVSEMASKSYKCSFKCTIKLHSSNLQTFLSSYLYVAHISVPEWVDLCKRARV